jgi:hypothetical protein
MSRARRKRRAKQAEDLLKEASQKAVTLRDGAAVKMEDSIKAAEKLSGRARRAARKKAVDLRQEAVTRGHEAAERVEEGVKAAEKLTGRARRRAKKEVAHAEKRAKRAARKARTTLRGKVSSLPLAR